MSHAKTPACVLRLRRRIGLRLGRLRRPKRNLVLKAADTLKALEQMRELLEHATATRRRGDLTTEEAVTVARLVHDFRLLMGAGIGRALRYLEHAARRGAAPTTNPAPTAASAAQEPSQQEP